MEMHRSHPLRFVVPLSALAVLGAASALFGAFSLPGVPTKLPTPALPKQEAATESAGTPTAALPKYTGPKKRLGIMDMEVKVMATSTAQPMAGGGMVQTTTVSIPAPTDFGTGLTEMLTTSLVNTGRFICLERKAMADINAEQMLMAGPMADASSAPGTGKLLGAQALIRGAVTEYSYTSSSTGGSASFLKGIGVSASRAQASVTLDIRLYDVATGIIIDSVKAEGKASSSSAGVSIDKPNWQMAGSGFAQTPLGHATRQAIDRAVASVCARMETIPWEGRVAAVEDEGGSPTLYINAGSKVGLKGGDKLQVLTPGKPIIDPETKTVIGRMKDKVLGVIQISAAQEGVSFASPLEGQGFQANDIVRFIDPNAKSAAWTKPADPVPATPAPADAAPAAAPATETPAPSEAAPVAPQTQ